MLAITRASLLATFRSPQSVFFSLFFPIVLIWIFGSLGGNGTPSVDVAFEKGIDTTSTLYASLSQNPVLHVERDADKDIEDALRKGRIAAVIGISAGDSGKQQVHLRTSSASMKDFSLLQSAVQASISHLDSLAFPGRPTVASVSRSVVEGRRYKMIDFFLPGMIGFALIGASVFGIAFPFYTLRETLVLKRMYATPIRRQFIILGESFSKVIFQMMTVVILVGFGYFVYGFTLANGFITFFDMMALSFLAVLVFLGFGFLITSIARNQNVIPIYANLFMFPQYFLSGTFFPKTALPDFLQPLIGFLPLTALNDAMRNVAFEGTSLFSCWPQVLVLLCWGILIYAVTTKLFRWE